MPGGHERLACVLVVLIPICVPVVLILVPGLVDLRLYVCELVLVRHPKTFTSSSSVSAQSLGGFNRRAARLLHLVPLPRMAALGSG